MRFKAKYMMNIFVMTVTSYVFVTALAWPLKASLFPLAIAIPVFFMALGDLVLHLAGGWKQENKAAVDFKFSEDVDKTLALRRTLITALWIVAFFLMAILLGFPASVPLFVFSYLKFQARESWKLSILITAVVWGIFWGLFMRLLHIQFLPGWLLQQTI